ncbi:MAG TPA: hypothetical protein VK463_01625 [Desulfomonilaceae bacterium]|nr:hypothetical protein [Desulfomonilaceae bacterium]
MSGIVRTIVVMVAALAFTTATLAVAADFYVVKDAAGKTSVVDTKPADVKSVVKGPFKTKDDAEKAMKSEGAAKKPTPPDQGC